MKKRGGCKGGKAERREREYRKGIQKETFGSVNDLILSDSEGRAAS